jgi:hypothetical protein
MYSGYAVSSICPGYSVAIYKQGCEAEPIEESEGSIVDTLAADAIGKNSIPSTTVMMNQLGGAGLYSFSNPIGDGLVPTVDAVPMTADVSAIRMPATRAKRSVARKPVRRFM